MTKSVSAKGRCNWIGCVALAQDPLVESKYASCYLSPVGEEVRRIASKLDLVRNLYRLLIT
jgi:hypothetical protein